MGVRVSPWAPNIIFMQNTTLVYLIKQKDHRISEICLAMKKRSFGIGKWNGVGGKVEVGEKLEDAAIRETQEEINVTPINFYKKAEIIFNFSNKPEWNQIVNIFFCDKWEGDPEESDEMMPKWFPVKEIPYSNMWPSDILWLPDLINGKLLKGEFTLGDKDEVLKKEIYSVESF